MIAGQFGAARFALAMAVTTTTTRLIAVASASPRLAHSNASQPIDCRAS